MNNTTYSFNLTTSLVPSSQIWVMFLAYNLYLILCMVLGYLGNLLVLIIYIKNGMKTSTDMFIVFISIYDFISSCVNVPVYLTFTIGFWKHFGNGVICKLHRVFSQSTVLSSAFLIGGLAVERYVKVCQPGTVWTNRFSRNICIILSVVTFVLSLPQILFYDNSTGTCSYAKGAQTEDWLRIYYVMFVLVFVMLFIVIIFSYSSIAIAILRSRANVARHSTSDSDNHNNMKCLACLKMVCCGSESDASKNVTRSRSATDDPRPSTSAQRHSTMSLSSEGIWHTPELRSAPEKLKTTMIGTPSRGHNNKAEREKKTLGVTRLAFLVCLVFVLSWIPPWTWFAVVPFATRTLDYQTLTALRLFCSMTFLINKFANPLIYIALNESFRNQVKQLLPFK